MWVLFKPFLGNIAGILVRNQPWRRQVVWGSWCELIISWGYLTVRWNAEFDGLWCFKTLAPLKGEHVSLTLKKTAVLDLLINKTQLAFYWRSRDRDWCVDGLFFHLLVRFFPPLKGDTHAFIPVWTGLLWKGHRVCSFPEANLQRRWKILDDKALPRTHSNIFTPC